MPGRRLFVAVVGVEIHGEGNVSVDLRRIRNVLGFERPEVIEVEVVAAAGRVLGECGGDLHRVIARRHAAAHLQIGSRAAVLVQVQIMRGCHAIDRDADLAAVGI